MIKQHSILKRTQVSGMGLHTNVPVHVAFLPAPPNTGIIFKRVDVTPAVSIVANTQNVSDTRMNTCLSRGGVCINTVEHVLSAVHGLGIDNMLIELDAKEPPALDGSALPFAKLLQDSGIVTQSADRKFMRITKSLRVSCGDAFIALHPYAGFKITMQIDFAHPFIAKTIQRYTLDISPNTYIKHIAPARTFGFLSEYEKLRQHNLGLGASLENTLVLDEVGLKSPGGLRDQAEFVKHKILDAVGDLSLLGYPLMAAFVGYKSGHTLNHLLRRYLLENTDTWEWAS